MSDELPPIDEPAVEQATQRLGRQIFDQIATSRPTIFGAQWWDEQIMDLAMGEDAVKVQLFRFVDVLPMLRSPDAIVAHLHEYFQDVQPQLPAAIRWALSAATPGSLAGRALAKAARAGAERQARRFIAGTTLKEVGQAVRRERRRNRAFTLDILGEAVTSDEEAESYFDAYLNLIRGVAPVVNAWPEVRAIDRDDRGPLPRTNVSIKLSALDSQVDEIDPGGSTRRVAHRLRQLLRLAREQHAFINVDMESYHLKDLTLAIFTEVLEEEEFRTTEDVGIVIQCYLKDSERDLHRLRDWVKRRGTPIGVRLVKGAYWDYESIHAEAIGWPVPVYQKKWRTDANFENQCRYVMQNHELLRPAIASHNVRSIAYGLALAEHLRLPRNAFELQMLYGMADPEKQVLTDMGYRLRVYMPYGELIPGMAYLVRRLLENTSNQSFLRATFVENVSPEKLLADPARHGRQRSRNELEDEPREVHKPPADSNRQGTTLQTDKRRNPFWETFTNEPPRDFADPTYRDAFRESLDQVREQFDQYYPLVVGGVRIETDDVIVSSDPSQKDRRVGRAAAATAAHAEQAVAAAAEAQLAWSTSPVEIRASYLRRAAEAMRCRRSELAAWIVYECGKGWREADGDVCEAIDFCEYYAHAAEALFADRGVYRPGEENRFVYHARGVAAVIAPWNFPLAILTGMTAAALVTGNTVVMKPAEQTPVVAALLADIFTDIGLPTGVLNYLPGQGEIAGAALVDHPDVALILFTGSQAVGLAIHARAAELAQSSTKQVKRVIAEMGGKNAIVVDDDADLDEAVLGVVNSTFGYQGQKCSACSRAIVLDAAYDTFLSRLIQAARSLKMGPADDPSARLGPVIDQAALDNIHRYLEIGRGEGRQVLAVEGGDLAESGHFVGPHIFADVQVDARIAQEEIFGPVLGVIRARNLDDAFRFANATRYRLTGGFYSRSPRNLDRARHEFNVGNLYLNRPCTGALVGRQPFGGFGMSGIGNKAGGADYLLQFVVSKTVTENTLRRGFAPTPESEGELAG